MSRATRWSILWLVVGVALAPPVGLVAGGDVAVEYLTVYLVVHVPPTASLAGVLLILAVGVALSLAVDRRRPPQPAERQVRRPPRCPAPPTGPRRTVA